MNEDNGTNLQQDALLFKTQVQEKITNLLDEFAMGKISSEQFNVLYKRYSDRLEIAETALDGDEIDLMAVLQGGPSTLDIRTRTEGKAMGVVVYHHLSGTILETLGEISVMTVDYVNILNQMARSRSRDPRLEQRGEKQWLLFLTHNYTSIVTEFENEPSRQQIRTLERLHKDFEAANRHAFETGTGIDPQKLAYPFLVFVKKQMKK